MGRKIVLTVLYATYARLYFRVCVSVFGLSQSESYCLRQRWLHSAIKEKKNPPCRPSSEALWTAGGGEGGIINWDIGMR